MSSSNPGGNSGGRAKGCPTAVALFACAVLLAAPTVLAVEISFRSFSGSAAIGPPADDYAAKLSSLSATVLGKDGQIRFKKSTPTPGIPKDFKSILAAVGAGGPLAGGTGFDAAYISGSDLDPTWGFIYNSGVPFGPNFDEFAGFLYGKAVDNGTTTGLDLLQQILEKSGSNVVAVPMGAATRAPATSCCPSATPARRPGSA